MVVTVYARHSSTCPHRNMKNAGQYRRCKCPLWLRWGKRHKRSAGTRSWEIAIKGARKLEEELERKALGLEPLKRPAATTIDEALELYFVDRAQRGIKESSKAKRLLGLLRNYAHARNAIYLEDVSARMLTEWRATWTFNRQSGGPAVAWSIVKTFFRWAHSIDLVSSNVSAKLQSLPIVRTQVQPLTKDEMARLLAATSQCGLSTEVEQRVRTFILLQRWSGLACVDAATLKRELLGDDDNLTQVHRTKTDAEVFIPLPPPVAAMLRSHPNDHPDYFFWNPDRMAKPSLVCQFGDWMRLVFDKAGVKHGQQEMLTHRFRHTFAVELLLAGVRIEQVSKLLGHKTVRTTERYYSAWVKERQRKLEAEVKQAWSKMELPTASGARMNAAAASSNLAEAVIDGMIQ
ncbi:tyrosine-type recombinase/integrase [Occallatibacter savannae]|uniref:tyrosine-type recombinase/integrase n=1 Tax=Occallatibacter savannae TaxID=1002691 RepID=UPI0013A5ADDD|nr:tyrosine-type recombinase/integrase [Occallatibacter savannae]